MVRIHPDPPTSEPRACTKSGGAIAQLGERLLCKQEVIGSIPIGSTSTMVAKHRQNQTVVAKHRQKNEESGISRASHRVIDQCFFETRSIDRLLFNNLG